MDDDDDSGLLDIIGDPQALNFFLHGAGCKSAGEELTSTDFSASNSNSIFANTSLTDSKSSIKSVQSLAEEESTEGLQLSNNIQFFEDELESSPIPDLSEDILQKSLQEANITEQILAEEAYLDASVGSSQQFTSVPSHAHSSASLTPATNAASYSGQTLHPIGVTHVVPQQVGASFASNTVGVQHGFMQPVGVLPSQHIPTSSHSGSGQIHLIGSINNQSPVMTINNLDGSQIILKSGQQAPPSSSSGGVLVQSHTPNGSTMFASPNVSPAGQQVSVPFSSGNFQTSLPVHNIIIHRGPAPNALKGPINIQPKPMHVGQQMSYSVSNLGIHHHRHQGAHCVPGNSTQSPGMGQQIPVTHQRSHKPSSQQSGGSIVIHSPLGEAHTHHNQFLIPAGLSINSGSLQHIQAINTQFVQTQPSHLGSHQVPTEHIMLSRNTGGMVRPSQHYPGQMLHSPGTAVQLVSGQTFSSQGGQVILNQGPSQIVGGQVAQVSPTLLHLSPGQGNKVQGGSTTSGCSNMTMSNRFTVVNPGTVLQGMGPSFQSSGSGDNYVEGQNDRLHPAVNETLLPGCNTKSNSMFCSNTNSKQPFSCNQSQQKKNPNHHCTGSLMKNQEGQSNTPDHSAGVKHLHHQLSLSKEALMGLQNTEVESRPGILKRRATKQLNKEALFLQQLRKEQERSLQPDRSRFQSLDNACQRLFPYHVFQGSLPMEEDLQQVDNEFQSAATHLLKKTQAMLNKYRLLLFEDAMRITPSAEMVMLDRMFNQEERAMLTREKRMALVDPDGYLSEFCCIHKFQESSSDEKVLSSQDTDAAADPTLSDTCPRADDSNDETKVDDVHDTPLSVPKNNSPSHKSSDTSEDKDSLNRDSNLKNTSLLPQKQLFVSLYKLKRKYTECSSDSDAPCKTSKKPDHVANAPMTIPVTGSNEDTGDVEHLQGKAAGPSQDATCKPRDVAASPGKTCKTSTSSESVKATVRNVLELKLSAKHFKSDTSSSNSTDLPFVKPPVPMLEENCADKPISDAREGAAETDSVLEAAVNSILEC